VASRLMGSSPDRAVRVRALTGDIVLCSWAKHFTLTLPLSAQVYKWVPAKLMLGVTMKVEIFLVASCYGNRDKLRPDGPLGSYTDLTFTLNDSGQQRYAETRRGCVVTPPANISLSNIFSTFYVTSCLHEQFSVCENFYLSHKS